MSQNLQKQELQELGSKLDSFNSTKDALIKLLKKAASCLSDVGQSQRDEVMDSMQLFINAIVRPWALNHQDKEVRLLVASCFCEITRITAPEAPYSDDVLKDIFRLIVSTINGLNDVSGPSFGRRVAILETLAKYKSCVVMLDLGCDDLVNEMFRAFFAIVSDNHPENVLTSIKTIMVVLIEESGQIHEDILFALLTVLGQTKNDTAAAAKRLAMDVVENSAVKLEPGIKHFLISSISGDNRSIFNKISYHEVIYNICLCAPQILSGIIPHITGELLLDQLETRLNAVKLVGSIFALPGSKASEIFQPIFPEFLKRFTDKALSVRMTVLEHAKKCLLSNPFRDDAHIIIDTLCDRLLDYDENIRRQVVAVICDLACHELTSIPVKTLKLVAERLRDKSLLVKKHTMERLAEIYMIYCSRLFDSSVTPIEFDWIPGKILRCLFDKDFRSDTIESILSTSLFPINFPVADKIVHWVDAFSSFDNVEIKALGKILEKKHMLHQEMKKFLSLRLDCQVHDSPELQKKVLQCFRVMSRCFTDSVEAEENFQILNQLKDGNVWNLFATLLDPNSSCAGVLSSRENLLKIIDGKHPLHDFMSALSLQCSYLLFNKNDVKRILHEVIVQKSVGNIQGLSACMGLLVIVTSSCPVLLNGAESDLVELLKDENEIIKEGVLNVLSKSGGSIREQLGELSSSLELVLERMCLEGSRKQAKHAVLALAAITTDDGLRSLSVLYKRLVDIMEKKTQLPAVLQCLGCIAQTAPPVFQTRESEIEEFVKNEILECSNRVDGTEKTSWNDRSELCSLKIYGLKMITKSYLPIKDVRLRDGIDKILGILRSILTFGEVSKDIESSLTDKAYLRLASAKAVLQLSRHWDHKIPVDVFHITIRTPETCYPQLKRLLLRKISQYSKDRILDAKYSCAFVFGIIGLNKQELEEERQNFSEIVQMLHQMKARKLPVLSEAKSQTMYPEYILPHLVHALAHLSLSSHATESRDVKILELPYRQLHFFLSALLHEDGKPESSSDTKKDTISTIVSIIRSIQNSDDAVDVGKTKNSHEISELALLITKRIAGKWDDDIQVMAPLTFLPPFLYKPRKEDEISEVLAEKSWLDDKNVLTHLESLDLDNNKTCNPEIAESGPCLGDHEADGNEVPLGKMLKIIKSKGTKPRKVVGNVRAKVVPKMAHKPYSDDMKMCIKFKKNNGKCFPRKSNQENKKNKGDRRIGLSPVSVPKRQRSSFSQGAFKFSSPVTTAKGFMQPIGDKFSTATSVVHPVETGPETQILTRDQTQRPAEDVMISSSPGNLSFPSEYINGGSDYRRGCESVGAKTDDPKKSDVKLGSKAIKKSKSAHAPVRKRKRRSISLLTKCSATLAVSNSADLINTRIKVWWPLDKAFYDGVVKSYDPEEKKHVVLYDDGDIESLFLDNERWKPINNKLNTPPKPTSLIDSSIRVAKRKRTPRKNRTTHAKKEKAVDEILEIDSRSCSDPTTLSSVVEGSVNGSENTENGTEHSRDMFSKSVNDDETTLSVWKGRVVGKQQQQEAGCV